MGDGMPYHLEKGGLLRVLETRLQGRPRVEMEDLHTRLQASEQSGSVDWIMGSKAWEHNAFRGSGRETGAERLADLLQHWFGRTETGELLAEGERPPPYWIGYEGRVDQIVVKALRWAVELALACGSDDKTAAGLEPWPIELFWKCPSPWFEAWVVSRRSGSENAGLVSVIFLTPSHSGASVAQSPIAVSARAQPDGVGHPVPSTQDDYELVGQVPHPVADRPRVPAQQRNFATWVVTHEENNPVLPDDPALANTTVPSGLYEWPIPQLATYRGEGDVVIVSPSMAAGGIKHDGGF